MTSEQRARDVESLVSTLADTPEMVALRVEDLAAMGLFEDCSAGQLAPVAGRLRPLRAEPGQLLMRQGEEAAFFVLIQSGQVEVTHTNPNPPHHSAAPASPQDRFHPVEGGGITRPGVFS